jgi:NADH:ubiquinone oxidoreductase subunit F (NADH-binding)
MRPAEASETAPVLEMLHERQEETGYLSEADIQAAAAAAEVSASEMYGAVTAYPRFRLEPAPATAAVCTGPACLMNGARELAPGDAETHCLGLCDQPVAALTSEGPRILRPGKEPALPAIPPPVIGVRESAFFGGDDPLAAARMALGMPPAELIAIIGDSGLQGRGGAGFPAGRKWEMVRAAAGDRKFLVCNLDESEPGTFKDRYILDHQPRRLIAGMIIAAHAAGAAQGVVYIRYEYQEQRRRLLAEIDAQRADGLLGDTFDIVVRRAAGLYVCGEESALLNSLEGKRPIPRDRPPYPTDAGLFGCPTLIQNAETLAAVPSIIAKGAAWYRDAGSSKLYCVSGDVPSPGVFELPLGTTARNLLERAGAGVVKAFTLGGLSGGLLPASALDVKLDFDDPRRYGAALGSGAVIVLGPSRCAVHFALEGMRFFAGESCGKCFPCRIGTTRLRERLEALAPALPPGAGLKPAPTRDGVQEMPDIIDVLHTGSACGLGPAAATLAKHLLTYFPAEIETHQQGHCPSGECDNV